YTQGSSTQKLMVSGGFVEVADDRVSVLAEVAETADEINVEKAKLEREQAEKLLSQTSAEPAALAAAQASFDRAATRIMLATGADK
ncbi:MAG: ATP synthase delta/epsilon chain alpha-helix domain-containing protein, partial [Pyrinomonadaceae bacterium]